MEIEGKIILDIPMVEGVSKAGNAWRKKEWVLETFGQYPKKVMFNVFGDRVSTLNFQLGRSYAVSVDIESREFNGRWYTDVRAYAARELTEGQPMGSAPMGDPMSAAPAGGYPPYGTPVAGMGGAPQGGFGGQQPTSFAPQGNDSDDLPF